MVEKQEPKRGLSVADIAAINDKKIEEISVPQWGGSVFLRSLPAKESIPLLETVQGLQGQENAVDRIIFIVLAACLCDEAGSVLFETETQARQVLGDRSLDSFEHVHKRAISILGWEKDAVKNASGEAAPVASPTA